VTRDVVRQVRQRAQERCEYCRLSASFYPLPFHVDHIKARQHGGLTVIENLAGADPNTGELIRLFNPRTDRWTEHFEWTGSVLAGRTAIGRVTIQVLAINDPDVVAVREALSEEQAFPLE
jgi:hypothetical protein